MAPSLPIACGISPTALESATAPPVHATGASARRCTGPERRQRRISTTSTPTSSTMPEGAERDLDRLEDRPAGR